MRKLCWKYSDKTKYEAIKSAVNKQELFYRYSTFNVPFQELLYLLTFSKSVLNFPVICRH